MSNEIEIFNNPLFGSVRAFADENGEPWFVAADVARVLDIQNTTDAIKCLDDDERARYNLGRSANGGGGETNIINESGLLAVLTDTSNPLTDAR